MIIKTFTLIVLSILITGLIIKFRDELSRKIGLIDYPKEKRKIHKFPTPLIGGIIIMVNLILVNVYMLLIYNLSSLNLLILLFCSISFFIGIFDDIKKSHH